MLKFLLKYNFHLLITYILLTFPIFYFVYKFGVLSGGYDDAKSYLKLFDNLSSKEVPTPFNMRLLSATCVHLLEKTGLFYNTECSIDMHSFVNKRIFFNNIFFNFICVSLTAFSLFLVFVKLNFSKLLSFLAGIIYLLGFGTIFYLMMPGVDALSVLIFTWVVYFYIKKSYWIIPLFLLLIFQREYYFLVFMVITVLDFFKFQKNKYYLHIFLLSVVSFLVYYILRKTIFYTDHWNFQTSPDYLINSLLRFDFPFITLIRQSLMTMNIYFIYILLLFYKKYKGYSINKHYLYTSILILLQITALSFATFGNNNGRYFCLNIPLILYYILFELSSFMQLEIKYKTNNEL